MCFQEQSRQRSTCLPGFPISPFWALCRCALLWRVREPTTPAQMGGPVCGAMMPVLWKGNKVGSYSSCKLSIQDQRQFLAMAEQYEEARSCLKELLIHPKFSYGMTIWGWGEVPLPEYFKHFPRCRAKTVYHHWGQFSFPNNTFYF